MTAQDRPGVFSNVEILLEDRSALLDDPGCLPDDLEDEDPDPIELELDWTNEEQVLYLRDFRDGLDAGRNNLPSMIEPGRECRGEFLARAFNEGWEAGRCGCNCIDPYPDGLAWPATSALNDDCPYHSAFRMPSAPTRRLTL